MAEEKSDVVIPEAESAEDKFAAERSHKASALAYDLCRVTAQTCLLINGGSRRFRVPDVAVLLKL